MHPGGRFLCLRTVQKGKPSLLLLQVDVVGQTSDVQRGQLGLDQRAGVFQELLGHLGVVFVHPAQRYLLLKVCHLADGVHVSIAQVNQTSLTNLLPVSTADLTNFVYSPSTVSDMAVTFEPVTDEQYYYHGRIYLRALAQGLSSDTTLSLYLDQTDGLLGKDVNGTLLNAARLGLVFNNDYTSSVILRLSESQNASGQQIFNTVVGGVTLGANQVLSWNGSSVFAVADPSVQIADYTVTFGASDMSVPQRPLCVMNLNQIYTVDVYFYLEGCDPDCSDAITHNEADLYLAFYGISGREGGQ